MHERKYFVIKYDHYDSYVAFFFLSDISVSTC